MREVPSWSSRCTFYIADSESNVLYLGYPSFMMLEHDIMCLCASQYACTAAASVLHSELLRVQTTMSYCSLQTIQWAFPFTLRLLTASNHTQTRTALCQQQ